MAETVILPAAIDLVQTMFSENCTQQLRNIPLSNNTVPRQIDDIRVRRTERLSEKVRNKCFSVQIDGVTDCGGIDHFIVYVRYVEDNDKHQKLCGHTV
jgi:hypothetical protein